MDDQSSEPLTFDAGAVDSVTVRAGTFRALPVRVSGGKATLIFYVSEAAPRRVVKVVVLEAPFVFELAK